MTDYNTPVTSQPGSMGDITKYYQGWVIVRYHQGQADHYYSKARKLIETARLVEQGGDTSNAHVLYGLAANEQSMASAYAASDRRLRGLEG